MQEVDFTGKPGYTLIELMITITIAGILASMAIPEYFQYVRESRRGDATSSIQDMMAQQALYYGNFGGTYTSHVSKLGFLEHGNKNSTISQDGHYIIELAPCELDTSYSECISIVATAASESQQKDLTCRAISLNSRGAQSAKSVDPNHAGDSKSAAVRAICWGNQPPPEVE